MQNERRFQEIQKLLIYIQLFLLEIWIYFKVFLGDCDAEEGTDRCPKSVPRRTKRRTVICRRINKSQNMSVGRRAILFHCKLEGSQKIHPGTTCFKILICHLFGTDTKPHICHQKLNPTDPINLVNRNLIPDGRQLSRSWTHEVLLLISVPAATIMVVATRN